MKILNLTNNETSDIKFEVSKFPDGQQQVKIPLKRTFHNTGTSRMEGYDYQSWNAESKNIVQIKARLNNFKDLELIICATKSLRELGIKEIHLYTPYFLGSRSDRKFEEGSNNYLKDVICPIINSLNFESVTVIDPHSDVLEACLNNFKKLDNTLLVDDTISTLYGDENVKWDNFILISPDAGANKKIFKIAEQIGYKGDIITCSKSRDENGKLSKVEIPISTQLLDKDIIIIDDICDGGATFLNIAKKLKQIYTGKIYLIVTHGIFSKGFDELNKYFDGIYCTNSYRDICDIEYDQKSNVKQLNVF
jgi:ribose-phosphate pyrophosphokinase